MPSTSTSPEISSVAASSSPEMVMFLPPVISIFASVTIALFAITVPFVIPSSFSSSASVNAALPTVIEVEAAKVPVTVRLSATVTSEVVCPIVIAIPEVSVAIFSAPVLFAIKEFVPSW